MVIKFISGMGSISFIGSDFKLFGLVAVFKINFKCVDGVFVPDSVAILELGHEQLGVLECEVDVMQFKKRHEEVCFNGVLVFLVDLLEEFEKLLFKFDALLSF